MEKISESEALQEFDGDAMAHDDFMLQKEQEYSRLIESMKSRYADNARAEIGATISCAYCSRKIVKRNYQTQFCRSKGSGNCKDSYWNNASDKRRLRAQLFSTEQ